MADTSSLCAPTSSAECESPSAPTRATETVQTNRLVDLLEVQVVAGGAEATLVHHLRQALEQERVELARREQAARDEVQAARAEADLTRRRAEEAFKALAESEQRYRIMGETIPFGVWWCNPKGEAEYVSPSFLDLLNMTLEEQNKFGWTQRLVPEDVQPMLDKWMHCCQTGTPWDHEHRIIDRHGKIHTVLSRGLPVCDEQQQAIAWVGVNLDITLRKQVELELQQAKEALEQAIHVKDQFLANISHELRTPLTLILVPLRKLLVADNLTAEQRHDLSVVERNARMLLKHVNDLLDLSKLDAGRMAAEYGEVDLAWLARFVASHFESVAEERQIRFAVCTPDTLPAQADPEKFQRVLFNLLSNAVKFTPAEGTVCFSVHKQGNRAIVTVSDTGPGIPGELREMVFERFCQVDSAVTRRYGGTGLGLAIAREFVALHHGTISAREAPGGGALFEAEIPLAAPPGVEVQAAVAMSDSEIGRGAVAELRASVGHPRQAAAVVPGAPLVLVVEDNPEMNAFLAETLGSRYRVATAFDGQEGLEKALALQPDLILSDIMMPRMSGEDLVREFRRRKDLDGVPILLLTAKADESVRVRVLSSGAQDCLVKPFVTEELLVRAGGLIARRRDELRRICAELEHRVAQRTDELARANSELEAFAYTVSHDLRAPLRHVAGFIELLEKRARSSLDKESNKYLEMISQSATRMGRLIDDLLALSRVGRAIMSQTDVDLRQLVEEAILELGPQTVDRVLEWHVAPLPHVQGDQALLHNVIVNLLSNAIKYTRRKNPARIEVGCQEQTQEVVCFVRDNGAGFDMRFADKLFGVFERLHPAEQFEGTGVGLASVRRIIERHGGRVWAEGAVDHGATFYFSLPAQGQSK